MSGKLFTEKIEDSCEEICRFLRLLSHPQRLMILCHLRYGTKSVSELQDLCGVSQSQLSQFLARMKAEGLVESHREGQYQLYGIADKRVAALLENVASVFCCVKRKAKGQGLSGRS